MEKQNWKIEFNWIKAHAGHHGNQLADQIAKEASTNSESTSATKGSQKVQ
jgi:ribonuclease HI